LSENHCRVAGERALEPIHGSLDAFVNNVANNRLIAETDGGSLHLFNDGKRAIVLGNITTGPIQVDDGPVPPPFDQLNIRMP
jgi:hypothetical protein